MGIDILKAEEYTELTEIFKIKSKSTKQDLKKKR